MSSATKPAVSGDFKNHLHNNPSRRFTRDVVFNFESFRSYDLAVVPVALVYAARFGAADDYVVEDVHACLLYTSPSPRD